MTKAYDIIKKPVLTEKSYMEMANKKFTFEVAINANKTEIKAAIEEIFGKMKRQGRTQGRTPEVKKAIVTLKKDSKNIPFFEGMAEEIEEA